MLEKNGLEHCYIMKHNKRLRFGYTTGSCAAAAAKAAARMLLLKEPVSQVDLMTPKGILLHLKIQKVQKTGQNVSCAVQKDGGDDPDATHGLLIHATVQRTDMPGIQIEGGTGVGRITKKGLLQPVGEAAINPMPRRMIEEEVGKVCEEAGYTKGIQVVIWVPDGETAAKKTFNPRLGIQGGISILGTSGIVVPMSEEALVASIRLEMQMRAANGADYLLITPGNYGADYLKQKQGLDLEQAMKCSNFVGETVDMAVELGLKGILFVSHIGKFIKVSGGIMNTHSRNADARAELLAAHATRAGAGIQMIKEILKTITTEEAISLLDQNGLVAPAMESVIEKIQYYLQHRCGQAIQTEVILFSNQYGYLGESPGAEAMLKQFTKAK